MSYAFAKPHALAYSFVGIQTLVLATNFPQIYWNCACLIVNAGGTDLLEIDINEEDDEKKKNKTSNYGKVAKAIGESKNKGINKSSSSTIQSPKASNINSCTSSLVISFGKYSFKFSTITIPFIFDFL